jgi:hypothetical protein
MGRVATKTGIANLTLSHLKNDTVPSIDPPTAGLKAARIMSQWYDDTRREVLSESNWDFALKRAQLPAAADAPLFGWSAKYLLPADYIRISTIGDESNPETDYEIEQGHILCNLAAPINIRYVFDQEDISTFSPKFIQAFIRKLAANTAYDLTGSRTMAAEKEAEYRDYVSDGKALDSQQNPPKLVHRSRWKAAKEGRGNAFYDGRVVV